MSEDLNQPDDLNVDLEELDTNPPVTDTNPPAPDSNLPATEPNIPAPDSNLPATEEVVATTSTNVQLPPVEMSYPAVKADDPRLEVKIMDTEIMNMQWKQITASYPLTQRLTDELERQSMQLSQLRDALLNKIKRLSAQTDVLSRVMVRHERTGHKKQEADIQAYLKKQNEIRTEKALRTKEFLQGIPAKEVMKAMNPKSKLDQVLNAKRGGSENVRKYIPLGAGRG